MGRERESNTLCLPCKAMGEGLWSYILPDFTRVCKLGSHRPGTVSKEERPIAPRVEKWGQQKSWTELWNNHQAGDGEERETQGKR